MHYLQLNDVSPYHPWSWDRNATIRLLAGIFLMKLLLSWGERIRWLLNGPGLLASKYTSGKPFTIQTPERTFTLVSSIDHIQELSRAKEDVLSLVATAEEVYDPLTALLSYAAFLDNTGKVFQPAHTMNGVELHRLGMQHRILRTMSLNLTQLQSPLSVLIHGAITQSLDISAGAQAWKEISIFNLSQRAIAQANTYTFYGPRFTTDEEFLHAALWYPQDVFLAAEALRCTPGCLAPLVSWLVTRGHRSSEILMSKLLPVFQARIQGKESPSNPDYIQHIVDVFPEESPEMASKMVNQTLALWFASVHQPAIALCNAIKDLCIHESYLQPLREEIDQNVRTFGQLDCNKLPLMESFLKESARMNASESISLRRKAQQEFTFEDGLTIGKGEWLCVPQREIMRDSTIYPDADQFKGFRFVDDHKNNPHSTKTAKFADIHTFFPVWGLGKHACPGRFYASFVIKLVLAELLSNYEFRIPKHSTWRNIRWRSSIIPTASSKFEVRPRDSKLDISLDRLR